VRVVGISLARPKMHMTIFALTLRRHPLSTTVLCVSQATYTREGASRPSPWAGRSLRVSVVICPEYPIKAPTVNFPPNTMWHPNVDFPSGEVCAIRSSFGPTKKLTDIGTQLAEYLNKPDVKDPTNADAAADFVNDIAKFETMARSKQAI